MAGVSSELSPPAQGILSDLMRPTWRGRGAVEDLDVDRSADDVDAALMELVRGGWVSIGLIARSYGPSSTSRAGRTAGGGGSVGAMKRMLPQVLALDDLEQGGE